MTMRRSILVSAVLCSALLGAAVPSALAEVRLLAPAGLGQPHRVRVLPTPAGSWTPVGPANSTLLNASGDSHDDGPPVVLTSSSRVVVAWVRPGEGLFLAAADRRWTESVAISAPLVVGAPIFVDSHIGAAVAWSTADGLTNVAGLSSALPIGVGEAVTLPGAGLLVALAPIGAGAILVTRDGVDLTVHWILFTTLVPTIPIPISLRESLSIHSAALGTTPDPTIPVEITKRIPAPPVPTLHEIIHRQAEPTLVLTWWISPTSLGWIELASTGPISSERIIHGNANQSYSPSLINEALRQAAGR